jgi:hypothetical protein
MANSRFRPGAERTRQNGGNDREIADAVSLLRCAHQRRRLGWIDIVRLLRRLSVGLLLTEVRDIGRGEERRSVLTSIAEHQRLGLILSDRVNL